MTRVLLVGEDPATVDFSDPALPPGLTAEKIAAGIETAMRTMRAKGWTADMCMVRPDGSAADAVRRRLAAATYDCVVIGGGIRMPPKHLRLFESIVNVVHREAPAAAIAFNTSPEDSTDAAARWVNG